MVMSVAEKLRWSGGVSTRKSLQPRFEVAAFPRNNRIIYSASMEKKPKYVARIDNVYFINRIGATLREATSHVTTEELPENIRRLLRRLKRLEVRAISRKTD